MPQSFAVIGALTSVCAATALYIIVIASYSPTPPLDGQAAAVVMVSPFLVFLWWNQQVKPGAQYSVFLGVPLRVYWRA